MFCNSKLIFTKSQSQFFSIGYGQEEWRQLIDGAAQTLGLPLVTDCPQRGWESGGKSKRKPNLFHQLMSNAKISTLKCGGVRADDRKDSTATSLSSHSHWEKLCFWYLPFTWWSVRHVRVGPSVSVWVCSDGGSPEKKPRLILRRKSLNYLSKTRVR